MNVAVSILKGAAYKRVKHDFYAEPRWLVDSLLDVERFAGTVLDPACGSGTIVSCCRERGIAAVGSDIVDRGFRGVVVQDFFRRTAKVDAIICNPPYGLAQRFVEHGLRLAPKVVMLLRLVFMEGQGRRDFFDRMPPARVFVTARRASIPAGVSNGPYDRHGAVVQPGGSGGSVVFAWFVWEHGHRGDTVLRRLEWDDTGVSNVQAVNPCWVRWVA